VLRTWAATQRIIARWAGKARIAVAEHASSRCLKAVPVIRAVIRAHLYLFLTRLPHPAGGALTFRTNLSVWLNDIQAFPESVAVVAAAHLLASIAEPTVRTKTLSIMANAIFCAGLNTGGVVKYQRLSGWGGGGSIERRIRLAAASFVRVKGIAISALLFTTNIALLAVVTVESLVTSADRRGLMMTVLITRSAAVEAAFVSLFSAFTSLVIIIMKLVVFRRGGGGRGKSRKRGAFAPSKAKNVFVRTSGHTQRLARTRPMLAEVAKKGAVTDARAFLTHPSF